MTAGLIKAEPGETVRHFSEWNRELHAALEVIESVAFVSELRYTLEEMTQRAGKGGFEGVLVSDARGPAAIMIFYPLEDHLNEENYIYLDTLAVRERGRGTGSRLLRYLIDRFRAEGFSGIELDTEAANDETGQDLPAIYRRFGFVQVTSATRPALTKIPDNLTMRLTFKNGAGARQHIVPPDPPETGLPSQ